MATSLAEPYSLPEIPPALGEDGGKFWKYYDAVADELDDDLVKRLKSQLDGLLIFAGLFAGINSGFLAMTLPLMSADPADDTNALLLQLVKGNDNTTQVDTNLPSSSFSPTPSIYTVNVLFAISLTFALASSFLAVLGQQWLVHYQKRGGGGPDHERWERLRRHIGAKRWKLELVLDDILPGLLQLGVAIFCASFVIYLGTLSSTMWALVTVPILGLLGGLLFMATAAAWDQWCPFQSPLSRAMYYCLPLVAKPAEAVIICISRGIGSLIMAARYSSRTFWRSLGICSSWFGRHQPTPMPILDHEPAVIGGARVINKWIKEHVRRSPDDPSKLQFLALKRLICASEDQKALDCAIANLRAVDDARIVRLIVADDEMHDRLRNLALSSSTTRYTSLVPYQRRALYVEGFMHAVLLGGSLPDFLSSQEKGLSSTEDVEEIYGGVQSYVQSLWQQVHSGSYDAIYSSSSYATASVSLSYIAEVSFVACDLKNAGGSFLWEFTDFFLSGLRNEPSDKVIAIAACKIMMMGELYQIEATRDLEKLSNWIRISFANLQNAYTTGFTAAKEYLQRAMEIIPNDSDLILSPVTELYVMVICATFNWQAKHKLQLELDFLLHISSYIEGIWNRLESKLKNYALGRATRQECFATAFRISHLIIKHRDYFSSMKIAAYESIINSLVGHLRFVMETSTPEAELDNELLQLIRSFFSVLHVQFFIGNGAGERAFTLLLRTAENFERWIWSKTRVSSRRLIRDPEVQWCEWREDCRRQRRDGI